MFEMFQTWYKQKFNDPQIVALLAILLIGLERSISSAIC